MSKPKVDDVVALYMDLRGKKDEIERQAKEKVNAIKEKMAKLEAYLLQRMQEDGVNQFKTPHGTAFSVSSDYASVVSWSDTLEYIVKNEAFDLLEKRVNKLAVRSLVENGQQPPPGVNYGTRLDVNIRKPSRSE